MTRTTIDSMSRNATKEKQEQLPPGREHIECDAPGCSRPGPPKRCSRCHRGFYCNTTCQRTHWRCGHREECFEVDIIRKQCLNIGKADGGEVGENETDFDKHDNDNDKDKDSAEEKRPTNTCCFICLSEPMVDPFVLPNCGHAFCFACLQSWQSFANSTGSYNNNPPEERGPPKCPACRQEAPNIVQSVHETAVLYAARANNDHLKEDEQKRYSELALEELDKVDPNAAIDPSQKIQTLFTRAEVLQQLERPEEGFRALKEAEALHLEGTENRNEILRLLDDYKEASDEGRIVDAEAIHSKIEELKDSDFNIASLGDTNAFDLYLNMAHCKEGMGDYKGALEIYKFNVMATMDEANSTPPQQRKMLMGMSKCMYHLRKYELAVELGESAIEMNRYFPQVHKYVALSQKAGGKLSAAIRTMGRAVNYETPWDEANRKIVLEMYEELKKDECIAAEALAEE